LEYHETTSQSSCDIRASCQLSFAIASFVICFNKYTQERQGPNFSWCHGLCGPYISRLGLYLRKW